MGMIFRTAAAILALTVPCLSARLSGPALHAYETYAASVEKRFVKRHASPDTYLATLNVGATDRVEVERQLRSGNLRVEPVNVGTRQVDGGLLHHWRGAAFVSGARASDMLALLRDYNRLSSYYAPEVESARLVADRAGVATVAMRFRKQMVVTVVLDSEYDVQTGLTSAGTGYSVSRSAHIWEIDHPGTEHERRMTEGDDDGFLWRLNTYWSFVEVPDGLFIECEAISLTRDLQTGLGWLVAPAIQNMPSDSLKFTLTATRNALVSSALKEACP
jgi:hypothetical protein